MNKIPNAGELAAEAWTADSRLKDTDRSRACGKDPAVLALKILIRHSKGLALFDPFLII